MNLESADLVSAITWVGSNRNLRGRLQKKEIEWPSWRATAGSSVRKRVRQFEVLLLFALLGWLLLLLILLLLLLHPRGEFSPCLNSDPEE